MEIVTERRTRVRISCGVEWKRSGWNRGNIRSGRVWWRVVETILSTVPDEGRILVVPAIALTGGDHPGENIANRKLKIANWSALGGFQIATLRTTLKIVNRKLPQPSGRGTGPVNLSGFQPTTRGYCEFRI